MDWRLDDFLRLLPFTNHPLQSLDGLRRKEVLAGFDAHSRGHVLDGNKSTVLFERVRDFPLDHRFFPRGNAYPELLPRLEINPQIRIGLIKRNDYDQMARRVAASETG
jgi:hypothetical protein